MKDLIVSSVESLTLNIAKMYNLPLNISMVKSISMSHKGGSNMDAFIIEFNMNGKDVVWMYPTKKKRDKDYMAILDNYSINIGDI